MTSLISFSGLCSASLTYVITREIHCKSELIFNKETSELKLEWHFI